MSTEHEPNIRWLETLAAGRESGDMQGMLAPRETFARIAADYRKLVSEIAAIRKRSEGTKGVPSGLMCAKCGSGQIERQKQRQGT